jgi:hypothetical protein
MLLKIPNMKFQGYPAGRSRPHASGVTEGHGEANTLLRSANVLKRHVYPIQTLEEGLTSLRMNGRTHTDTEQIFQKQPCFLFLFF